MIFFPDSTLNLFPVRVFCFFLSTLLSNVQHFQTVLKKISKNGSRINNRVFGTIFTAVEGGSHPGGTRCNISKCDLPRDDNTATVIGWQIRVNRSPTYTVTIPITASTRSNGVLRVSAANERRRTLSYFGSYL